MSKCASSLSVQRGTLIAGTYRLAETLGEGGMGIVFRARDEQLERDVAVKLIRPELLTDDLRERFLVEARAMARVSHPNVLPIYSFGAHEGAPYFVTQIVRGDTVEGWLRARPPGIAPDLVVALRILEETCRGVAAIHAADTVHRDLKPSNLLLDPEFGVRVADMGVATLRKVDIEIGKSGLGLVGTPEYMAPEAVAQDAVPPELAHRGDVYALGCIAFTLLTGRPPFSGGSSLKQMMSHLTTPIPRLSSLRSDIAPELEELVASALAKDLHERLPSAEAFLRGLAAIRAKTRLPVRILVADDEDDFRELLLEVLIEEFPDAIVELVADGQTAIEAFDAHQPSVALVDLHMPGLGGSELVEVLRSRPDAQNVPIVVLTGSGGPAEWKRLSTLGADGFLVKPVHGKDVAMLMRRLLEERARQTPLPAEVRSIRVTERERVRACQNGSSRL
jgi:eukaryotic-like serine/threonine-protein kinase